MMIGPLCKSYSSTLEVLKKLKIQGFDAIELNSYMIHKTPVFARVLTRLAGMPCGKAGKFNWKKLISESQLKVASLHADLDSLEKESDRIIKEAKDFNSKYLVITGFYNFNYTSKKELEKLSLRLNKMGEETLKNGLMLLYHNHNVEFKRLSKGQFVYDFLVELLDEKFVNFEFDSYWASEAGINIYKLMERLGSRIKLHHINDRGSKKKSPFFTPILKSDSMELGTGCIDLKSLLEIDKKNNIDYVVLESHKNYINNSRIDSIEISAKFLNENI